MRTRLGWTISYKSLYFVHPSLELVPLFTGMRERSIDTNILGYNIQQNMVIIEMLFMQTIIRKCPTNSLRKRLLNPSQTSLRELSHPLNIALHHTTVKKKNSTSLQIRVLKLWIGWNLLTYEKWKPKTIATWSRALSRAWRRYKSDLLQVLVGALNSSRPF